MSDFPNLWLVSTACWDSLSTLLQAGIACLASLAYDWLITDGCFNSFSVNPYYAIAHDDICIFGKTQLEHNENLLQLMKVSQKNGLVFISNNCYVIQPEISFYGALFSAKGMKPDPKRSSSFTRPSNTTNTEETTIISSTHKLLTTISTRHSSQDHLLREQVSNWDWTPSTDALFHQLKHDGSATPYLKLH